MKTAIYARVSVKHQNHKDLSIEAQINLCREYLKWKNEDADIEVFSDLGYSGRSFDRPAFLRLREQARKRQIRCVAVKDLSRLGRDYCRVGELVEKFFPAYGVRLLSVSEGYDSADIYGNPAALGLYHVLNEWYAKDIGRKVALVKREMKKSGNYLGCTAPYGYRIVKKNGIRMLEQDESFQILAAIYARHEAGNSSAEIVQWLWEQNVNPPAIYRRTGEVIQDEGKALRWQSGTVRNILTRRQL